MVRQLRRVPLLAVEDNMCTSKCLCSECALISQVNLHQIGFADPDHHR